MQPTTTMVDLTPQALADAVEHLVKLADSDYEVVAVLARCREGLRAISWERFRIRCEHASQQKTAARRRNAFIARHKGMKP
ncbi:MAG TPA: hypothetical protein VNL35_16685 [Chloroflexota bacterium]|nr:hypothetical protein [Chloroflexota bacterium]